jgi:hypothetical protein
MLRYDELSKYEEPLLPRQFCSDCIIVMHGKIIFRKDSGLVAVPTGQ